MQGRDIRRARGEAKTGPRLTSRWKRTVCLAPSAPFWRSWRFEGKLDEIKAPVPLHVPERVRGAGRHRGSGRHDMMLKAAIFLHAGFALGYMIAVETVLATL